MRVQCRQRGVAVALVERRPQKQRSEPHAPLHVPRPQVLGVDLLRTKDVRSTHRLVVDHIARVRTIPRTANSTVVLQLESNLAFECQHIIHSLQEKGVQKWVALSEGQGGTIGWLTTNERKEAMCLQLRDALRVGNIFLSEEFFSVMMDEREALRGIRDELCRFAIITEPAKTLFGKIQENLHGQNWWFE